MRSLNRGPKFEQDESVGWYPGLGQSEVDMCDQTGNIFSHSAGPFIKLMTVTN